MSVKWWEKTVEYLFVKKHVDEESLIIPFDGKEELQSDGALCVASKWILIEFKKEKNSIPHEKKKFNDFEAAYEKLHKRDFHHHIIYGSPVLNNGSINLVLKSQTYFSQQLNASIESLLMTGIEFEAFHSYLKDFVSFKKTTEEDAGGVVLDTNSNVVGVTSSGRVVECKSMKEYILEHCPEMAPPPPAPSPGSIMNGPC
ncbi:TPA: hypothetical protein I6182_003401 [Vibrio cholerae]|uniref:hypothetical protein n=1 Tax=Vibrio cholerae TaxID=666 RepID=UPI0018F0A514|nr:hypothetical protein [Vibrio cholerae]EGR2435248.1 hypothetical protein [Vibrio cholerae]EJL6630034.1 hypothetical protein [Vibrio cholerae]EJL6742738.1 hypothetical protein [Vibrio cholerae]MBJ6907153.1 hypothetical protein [Vibrio cholerae]MCX9469321.1 hypothetical protein [Vibrio cholerae]